MKQKVITEAIQYKANFKLLQIKLVKKFKESNI